MHNEPCEKRNLANLRCFPVTLHVGQTNDMIVRKPHNSAPESPLFFQSEKNTQSRIVQPVPVITSSVKMR